MNKETRYCSFCGRGEGDVSILVDGTYGSICAECAAQVNAIVNDNSVDFKRIEISNSLKFVFVKSKSQNAFDIPYSMKKYEVISD